MRSIFLVDERGKGEEGGDEKGRRGGGRGGRESDTIGRVIKTGGKGLSDIKRKISWSKHEKERTVKKFVCTCAR